MRIDNIANHLPRRLMTHCISSTSGGSALWSDRRRPSHSSVVYTQHHHHQDGDCFEAIFSAFVSSSPSLQYNDPAFVRAKSFHKKSSRCCSLGLTPFPSPSPSPSPPTRELMISSRIMFRRFLNKINEAVVEIYEGKNLSDTNIQMLGCFLVYISPIYCYAIATDISVDCGIPSRMFHRHSSINHLSS